MEKPFFSVIVPVYNAQQYLEDCVNSVLSQDTDDYELILADEVNDTERRLLLLEAAGCTASEISNRLGESDKAIQERQKDLSQRFDIVNKSAARVAKALSLGLISPTDINFLPRN